MESPPSSSPDPPIDQGASTAIACAQTVSKTNEPQSTSEPVNSKLPPISHPRLISSLQDQQNPEPPPPAPQTLKDDSHKDRTYLYLAYGSNLAASTFLGRRNIRPLAALNVVVPDLVLTFDLPGLPYTEPCFANTAYRSSSHSSPTQTPNENEKAPLLPTKSSNPQWTKGLVGVVYEVTATDYAHIIATEGGGASYHDILVTCHPLPPGSETVPANPTTEGFKAHTLYCPLATPGEKGGRLQRPNPSYAQPSQRYLGLITTGAEEHDIPLEYQEYLKSLKPYTITTQGQKVGRSVFSMTWWPIIFAMFTLSRMLSNEHGRSPKWLARLLGVVFAGVWWSYDEVMKGLFGDGERTIEKGDEGTGRKRKRLVKKQRNGMGVGKKDSWVDDA
ncbi:MAG: hypothetical protein Q9201_001167 [Fulgogasparrea decipioides]